MRLVDAKSCTSPLMNISYSPEYFIPNEREPELKTPRLKPEAIFINILLV